MNPAARPYAEALFTAASDAGSADAVLAELDAVASGLARVPTARRLLEHPSLNPAAAAGLVDDLGKGRNPVVIGFLRLLLRKRRVALLDDVVVALRARLDAVEGRARATLQAARPLDPSEVTALAGALGRRWGKTVTVTAEVRPELIGGVRIVSGDRILDGSVAGQLAALGRRLRTRGALGSQG